MPSPKYVRKTYAIHYEDSTYMIFDLTKEDITQLENAILDTKSAVKLSVGTLKLYQVRSVIEQKPEPKVDKVNKSASPDLDTMTTAWLKEQEEELKKWEEDYSDVEGGRFS